MCSSCVLYKYTLQVQCFTSQSLIKPWIILPFCILFISLLAITDSPADLRSNSQTAGVLGGTHEAGIEVHWELTTMINPYEWGSCNTSWDACCGHTPKYAFFVPRSEVPVSSVIQVGEQGDNPSSDVGTT